MGQSGIVPGQLSDRGPQSTQRLLCTCQSNCDTNNLLGDMGDTLRGERGERSSTAGQSPTSRWLPLSALQKLHITKRNAAAGYCKSSVCRWMDRPTDPYRRSVMLRERHWFQQPDLKTDYETNKARSEKKLCCFLVPGISKVLWDFGTTLLDNKLLVICRYLQKSW